MEIKEMKYKDLDTDFKKKLSGSINFYLRNCDWKASDEDIIKDFLHYNLNEENGTYSYLDKKIFEHIGLNKDLVEDLIEVLKERLEKRRIKGQEEEEKTQRNFSSKEPATEKQLKYAGYLYSKAHGKKKTYKNGEYTREGINIEITKLKEEFDKLDKVIIEFSKLGKRARIL